MKIRFQRNFGAYRSGEVIVCDDRTAARLIADGVAIADRQASFIETATLEHGSESADVTPRRRKAH